MQEDYTEADKLFSTVMKLAEEGKINEAENELYMGMVEDDVDYLELALTFQLYLNDMDGNLSMTGIIFCWMCRKYCTMLRIQI